MSLVRWRRRHDLPAVLDDMDRMFDRYFRQPIRRGFYDEDFDYGPAIDVIETDTELVVKAELPGVSKDDIDLTLHEDRLLLSGGTRHEEETSGEGYVRREIRSGTFRRSIPLPAAIDAERLEASFDNGVLTIRAPKIEEQERGTKVEIK